MLSAILVVALWQTPGLLSVGKEGYLLLPPEIVCAPKVEEAAWSPDGRYVLARRTDLNATPSQLQKAIEGISPPPEPTTSLVLWSAQSRQGSEIWKAPTSQAWLQNTGWFAGGAVAYAIVSFRGGSTGSVLYRIPAATGKLESLASGEGQMYFFASPVRPVGLLGRMSAPSQVLPAGALIPASHESPTITWSVVGANGVIAGTVRGAHYGFPSGWSVDGKRAYFQIGPRAQAKWYQLDLDTHDMSETRAPQDLVREATPPSVRLDLGQAMVDGVPVRQLRLAAREGDSKPIPIAGDVGRIAELSPAVDGVFYDTSDTLFVRALITLDGERLKAMAEAAERSRIMSNVKQVVTALHIRSRDHNDQFPPPGDISSAVLPYLKNLSFTEGFVYTFAGG